MTAVHVPASVHTARVLLREALNAFRKEPTQDDFVLWPPPGEPAPTFCGLPVEVSELLPMRPSHTEDAVRMVRHGLADVLEWLGEDAGPRPGATVEAIIYAGPDQMMFVSRRLYGYLYGYLYGAAGSGGS